MRREAEFKKRKILEAEKEIVVLEIQQLEKEMSIIQCRKSRYTSRHMLKKYDDKLFTIRTKIRRLEHRLMKIEAAIAHTEPS
ncbi:hypothetical protein HCN83_01240 [Bacillus luteus]|uniref:Uncharacterized protein n=2 Tax=Alkalicoccus luteus TaxID=1237094 RepID=A0A969TTF5_9BACI|nr:hypothetical protein [Alkalicoccus luteus]